MTQRDEEKDILIEYEVVKHQRMMVETAREYLLDVEPLQTSIDDEEVITMKDFERWKRHLLNILGVTPDE